MISGVDYCVAGEATRVGRMAAVTNIPVKGALPKGAGALILGTEEATQATACIVYSSVHSANSYSHG